ncbi:MAG: plasmid recombination protein [Butyrivibrio sp.]|uniref:plasmid recombination protein n=1 Tax=Butyrivibrio sp. TaxID=28121 RepID=UPI001B2712D3|nr:plasmid recombination protein [Butyrivibrio sp.]MBO6240192.1 plasmid recombination protein [Butyrivibrio sp.]
MDGIDGYVSFRQEPKFNILHTIRDPEYMKKEEANYYAYYEKRKADGVLPPDFVPEPFYVHMEDVDKNMLLHYEPLKEFYEKTFQPAVDEYDQILLHDGKGHKDRVKGNYYSYIYQHDTKKNSTKLAYEVVVQFGGRDDDEKNGVKGISDDPEKREQCLEGLKRYYERWKKENPNLHIVAAAIHMDETSPHLHIIYVPVVESERGQKVRNDRSTALKSQLKMHGIDISKNGRQDNATTTWQERQRVVLREIAKEVGLDMKQTKKPTQRDHEDAREYRARRSADALESANNTTKYLIQENDKKLDTQEAQIEENSKTLLEQETQKSINKEELSNIENKIIDKNRELFLKDKPRFIGDKVKVDKQAFEAYQDFYNSGTQQKVRKEQTQLEKDREQLEADKNAFKQEKAQYKYKAEGQYKEKADKYDSLQSELFVSREDINKALDDYTISNAEVISMIRQYALFQPDNEKDALLKQCTALSKIDTYTQKSLVQRNKRLDKEKVFTEENWDFPEYENRIRDMLKKSLSYKGRTEIYQKDLLKGLWADIQKDNASFWKSRKTPKPEAVINLDKTFTAIIPRLIQTAIQAIKSYIEMIKQAQQQSEHDR